MINWNRSLLILLFFAKFSHTYVELADTFEHFEQFVKNNPYAIVVLDTEERIYEYDVLSLLTVMSTLPVYKERGIKWMLLKVDGLEQLVAQKADIKGYPGIYLSIDTPTQKSVLNISENKALYPDLYSNHDVTRLENMIGFFFKADLSSEQKELLAMQIKKLGSTTEERAKIPSVAVNTLQNQIQIPKAKEPIKKQPHHKIVAIKAVSHLKNQPKNVIKKDQKNPVKKVVTKNKKRRCGRGYRRRRRC